MSGTDSILTDRLGGSICRQFAEEFHDVFGEENPFVFFFAAGRIVVDGVDNLDIRWMDAGSVREPEDIYEFVGEYIHVDGRQGRCCGPRRRLGDCRNQSTGIL